MEPGEGSSSAPTNIFSFIAPMARDTAAQTGDATGTDWQQECYNKLQLIKVKYHAVLVDWLHWVHRRLQQQGLMPELCERLMEFRKMLLSLLSLLAAPKNAITYSIHSRMVFLENLILNIVSGHERFAPQALWNEQSQHLSVANALPRAYQALQVNVQASISLQAADMPVGNPVTASRLDYSSMQLWFQGNASVVNSGSCSMSINNSSTMMLGGNETVAEEKPKEPTFTCPICQGAMVSPSTTPCGHIFCDTCIRDVIQKRQKSCPICRKKISKSKIHRVYLPAAAV